MASRVSGWSLSAATNRGDFQATVGTEPYGLVSGTERVDVSEMLDLLALSDTPFINRIGWGPESGALSIQWISENLGPGFVRNLSQLDSMVVSIPLTAADGIAASESMYQIGNGSILYAYNSVDVSHTLFVVNSVQGGSTFIASCIAGVTMTHHTSIEAGQRLFILGRHANEGSRPGAAYPRQRVINSNNFVILREDVAIAGSMKETDFYAINREDKHQILMRMKEIQRAREKVSLYSDYSARSASEAATMYGVLGFLLRQGGDNIDITTKVLTESAFNTVVGAVWDNGGDRLVAFGAHNQIGKFTQWDKNRIRTTINEGKGGGHITKYLSEVGIEVELVPMRKVPRNILFVLDPSKLKLRAKKNRKFIMEKLGKAGDMDDYQLLTEFSMEMKGFDLGQHGMFTALTPSA